MKVLIFGAAGMLGNAMFRLLAQDSELCVVGTTRRRNTTRLCDVESGRLIEDVDIENSDVLIKTFAAVRPKCVVNCIGLVKQLSDSQNPLLAVPVNTLFPHRLAALCEAIGARLIHFSTDCVFSGKRGNYTELDFPDADDVYGRTKLLGELHYPHTLTIRTSMIGHEMTSNKGLVNWFLTQEGHVQGYTRAIFSGLPTVELATIVRDIVLTHPDLSGLYHVAARPISKYDLLHMIAKTYRKEIDILPTDVPVLDRSLNARKFDSATGYVPPSWPDLIERMYAFK